MVPTFSQAATTLDLCWLSGGPVALLPNTIFLICMYSLRAIKYNYNLTSVTLLPVQIGSLSLLHMAIC